MDKESFHLLTELQAMLCPCSTDEYPNAREIARENRKNKAAYESMKQKLSPEQDEQFEKCLEANLMWNATCEQGAFALGYQLGVRLLLAALADEPA